MTVWCDKPFHWYGIFFQSEEHILKALELDQTDDVARQTLLGWWLDRLYFSTHRLLEDYIGNPFDAIELGEKIKKYIQQLARAELKEIWTKNLEEY